MKRALLTVLLIAACGPTTHHSMNPATGRPMQNNRADTPSDEVAKHRDAMPADFIEHLRNHREGISHLQWHEERQWDRWQSSVNADDLKSWDMLINGLADATKTWKRAEVQEGGKGNGLHFLAMHHEMMARFIKAYPQYRDLFNGFANPNVDLKDKLKISARMKSSIDIVQDPVEAARRYKNSDDYGLFVQAGVHNYLHDQLATLNTDPELDMGDPAVNLRNKQFWNLHGWIENRWQAFQKQIGPGQYSPSARSLRPSDAADGYDDQAAIAEAVREAKAEMDAAMDLYMGYNIVEQDVPQSFFNAARAQTDALMQAAEYVIPAEPID